MAKAQPNLGWLEDARAALNSNPDYRKLGSTDVVLGLWLGDEARLVRFEAFEVAEINEIPPVELRDADLVLTMSPKDWNAWLRKRKQGKGPSLLTLDLEEGVIAGASPLSRIKFERYNLSLQAFLDTGANLGA